MGFIKEPKGVDLIVGPSVLLDKDKKIISKIIADYKEKRKSPTKSTSIKVDKHAMINEDMVEAKS